MATKSNDAVEIVMDAFDQFKNASDQKWMRMQDQLDNIEKVQNRPDLGGTPHQNSSTAMAERKMLAQLVRTGDEVEFMNAARTNGLMIGDDTAGGYLVSPAVSTQIVSALREVSPLRRLARIETIGLNAGGSFEEPKEIGEAGADWVGETQSRDETGDPDFGLTTVPLDELEAKVLVTQRLLDDSQFDIGGWLTSALARKFARSEGAAFSVGDGIKKPRGFAAYTTDLAGDASRAHDKWQHVMSGAAASLTADSIRSLFWSLGASYRTNGTWLMSSATASVIDQLKDGNGQYLWRQSEALGAPPTLLGRPVEIDENLPEVAAGSLPIWFGDWKRAYLILERVGIKFQRDPFTSRPNVVFYGYRRTGGGASDFYAAKALKIGV